MTPSLELRSLRLAAGARTLIDDLTIELNGPGIIAVLGVNGSGKTTLLETLCQARQPAHGRCLVNQDDLSLLPARERAARIGLMPQHIDTGFDQALVERVALGRYRRGGLWQWGAGEDLAAAELALDAVGLADLAARRTTTLSGGERQRMALAMLLVQAPDVMLLDEPFSALDPAHRARMAQVLAAERDAGRLLLFSVHDPNVAASLADQVLLLSGRGTWEIGPTDTLLTAERLSALYGTHVALIEDASGHRAFLTDVG